MSSTITKTIRLSRGHADSIEDTVRTVLARAAATISDIQSFRIVEVGGKVDDSACPQVRCDPRHHLRDQGPGRTWLSRFLTDPQIKTLDPQPTVAVRIRVHDR